MICDLILQPDLVSSVLNSPDLRFQLAIVFVGIVGLSAGLVLLEAIRHRVVSGKRC